MSTLTDRLNEINEAFRLNVLGVRIPEIDQAIAILKKIEFLVDDAPELLEAGAVVNCSDILRVLRSADAVSG